MTQNGIRPEGMSHLITTGLSECTKLEVLDMQDNTFTFKGATALSKAIKGWPFLKELGVGDSLLGARGSIKLFESFGDGHNEKLEILRLQYNDINPAGVKAVLQAAKNGLPNLRRIELNGNKFEEEDPSVEALSELLSERKDEHAQEDDSEDHWGLDELDELEGEDSDEEEEEEQDKDNEDNGDDEDSREKLLKDADTAEDQPVSQKTDTDVDDLADALKKTEI